MSNDELRELQLMRKALEIIASSFKKLVDEGITIYEHQNGEEELN